MFFFSLLLFFCFHSHTHIYTHTGTDCSLGMFMSFSKTPVFSTKPGVTAYDKETGGMLIGEGSVMFVLKRLSQAVKDGDTIHAVVGGCASSSDGKASGIYAPTISGQEKAIRRALEKAGKVPEDISVVEGHGTGTLYYVHSLSSHTHIHNSHRYSRRRFR